MIVLIFLVSGCARRYVSAPLPLPSKPAMPVYADNDLECLSDFQYHQVAERDLAQHYYQQQLEAVIRSTWNTNNGL